MIKLENIKNPIQQFETSMRRIGYSIKPGQQNDTISRPIAGFVAGRHEGRVRRGEAGKYTCSCNNWGPRSIENSQDGCCPGCWQWALDHHQEMYVNGVEPVTMAMIENATWGFNVDKIRELNIKKRMKSGSAAMFHYDTMYD